MSADTWEWVGSGVALLGVLAIGLAIYLVPYAAPKPVQIPSAGPISVHGQLVCLPHKNERGPQTLECAFGIQDVENRYFALRDSDPTYHNLTGVPTNVPIVVDGTFTPREDPKYQSIGVIEVTRIARTDTEERATLSGTFVCLPHKDGTPTESEECAYGLLTDTGAFYGLDLGITNTAVPNLTVGDRISASGAVIPIDELPASSWARYRAAAIFTVTDSFTFLSPDDLKSGIRGSVLLGPTCPVQRVPSDPACADKPYKATLSLTSADGSRVITTFTSDEEGNFSLSVTPGTYRIRSASSSSVWPRCASGDILVPPDVYAKVRVSCDTGIR